MQSRQVIVRMPKKARLEMTEQDIASHSYKQRKRSLKGARKQQRLDKAINHSF